MSQRIHLAAIVAREGQVWLVREQESAEWGLPGGPFLPEHADPEAGIGAYLATFGIEAAVAEDAFIETLFLPETDGHVVYNLYSAAPWRGEPMAGDGRHARWMAADELDGVRMNGRVRDAILEAYGIRERPDSTDELLSRLQEGVARAAQSMGWDEAENKDSPTGTRRDRGMDVLRTLGGGSDPAAGLASLRSRYGPLADDVVDFAMGEVWAEPGLDRRTRSLQVVAMLAALGRTGPLQNHVGGALNHGATPEELVQTIRLVAVYAGFPAALEAWQVMARVFEARGIPVPGATP
jgi:4-carboxymuconolactone decarboxylase